MQSDSSSDEKSAETDPVNENEQSNCKPLCLQQVIGPEGRLQHNYSIKQFSQSGWVLTVLTSIL